MPVTREAAKHIPNTKGAATQPPADLSAAALGERVVEVGAIHRLTTAPNDMPACDSRIPLTVWQAFRAAVRRVRNDKEFSPACDVHSADAVHALELICVGVGRV